MNYHTYKCQLVLLAFSGTHPQHSNGPSHAWVGRGVWGWPPPMLSGLELRAVAAGWPGGAAGLTADLQGRVLAPGYLAGAEGHGSIKLGLEQLKLLQRLQRLWGDLSHTPQQVVVLTRVLRQVKEQRGLMGSQRTRGMAGRVRSGVAVDRAWGGGQHICAQGKAGCGLWGYEGWAGLGERKLPWVKKCALYFPLRTAKTPRTSSG